LKEAGNEEAEVLRRQIMNLHLKRHRKPTRHQ